MLKNNGNYGFIQQDAGGENMFVLASSCATFGGQLPPVGTRLTYGVTTDQKTGRPRAAWVEPEASEFVVDAAYAGGEGGDFFADEAAAAPRGSGVWGPVAIGRRAPAAPY